MYKNLLKLSSCLLISGAIGTVAYSLTSCSNSKVLDISQTFDSVDEGILWQPNDSVTLSVTNANKEDVEWNDEPMEQYQDVLEFNISPTNDLVITVSANYKIAELTTFEIVASIGNDIGKATISVGKVVKIPLSTEYFTFAENGQNDTITGFSQLVKEDYDSLNEFNVWDFSNQTNVKYVDGNCTFETAIMNNWKVGIINFGSLTFLNNTSWKTGAGLFKEVNFSSLYSLNFGVSVWAIQQTNYSAYETFKKAKFPNLKELKINQAAFAASEMRNKGSYIFTGYETFSEIEAPKLKELDLSNISLAVPQMNEDDSLCVVHTGLEMFKKAEIPNLESLNLTNAKFAATGMTISGSVYTADCMFQNADLSNLKELNLSKTVFAATGMGGEPIVETARHTFASAILPKLIDLNLSETVFAATGMTQNGDIRTANNTFFSINFSSLTKLNLSGTIFAASGMNEEREIRTASYTFDSATFPSLTKLDLSETIFAVGEQELNFSPAYNTFLNTTFSDSFTKLYLPTEYDVNLGAWVNTFAPGHPGATISIYGYGACPTDWFSDSWWPDAIWVPTNN